jgi:hypothetical protein
MLNKENKYCITIYPQELEADGNHTSRPQSAYYA